MRKEKLSSTSSLVPATVFAIVALGYLVWFIPQSAARVSLLAELGDPFAFVAQWFGPAGTPLGFLDRIPVVLMAIAVLGAAYGFGRLLLDGLRLADALPATEHDVFALAAGMSLVSTAMLLLGLAGVLAWPMLLLVVLCGWLVGAWRVWHDIYWQGASLEINLKPRWRRQRPDRSPPGLGFLVILLLGSLLPPWDFDVREYHLQVPKEWLAQGQITFLPHNVYGNMPLAAEMPALLAMGLWPGEHGWFYGALAGKVVIAAFAAITAVGVACAGQRIAGKPGGILAAVVFLSHPWVIQVSINGLNDGVLACYVFLALYAIWLARRGECSYFLPGLLAGAAAAVKYPGLAFAVAPVAMWAMIPRRTFVRQEEGGSAGASPSQQASPSYGMAIVLVLAGILLGGGVWYAKNAVLTGNPVYPLAYGIFGGKTRTAEKAAQWDKAHQVPRDERGWRYSAGQLAGSALRVAGRDPLASPLVVPLMIAALFVLVSKVGSSHREEPAAGKVPRSVASNAQSASTGSPVPDGVRNLLWAFAALAWILAVWWFLSHRLDRFLLPAWPLVAVIAAVAALPEDRWWRRTVTVVVWIGLAYCYLAASSTLVGDNRWFVSLEQLRRDQPWPQHTPQRVKLSHRWLNENVKPGQAVLLVGDAEPFELEMPAFYNTCFDDCLLCDWMLNKSPSERHQELARRNIAWVVVDWPEIARYQQPGNYGFDPRFKAELLDELVQQGVLDPPVKLGEGYETRHTEAYPVRGVAPKPESAGGVQSR